MERSCQFLSLEEKFNAKGSIFPCTPHLPILDHLSTHIQSEVWVLMSPIHLLSVLMCYAGAG